eukprot:11163858-Lingulodinium_polyedra.AAC.1
MAACCLWLRAGCLCNQNNNRTSTSATCLAAASGLRSMPPRATVLSSGYAQTAPELLELLVGGRRLVVSGLRAAA